MECRGSSWEWAVRSITWRKLSINYQSLVEIWGHPKHPNKKGDSSENLQAFTSKLTKLKFPKFQMMIQLYGLINFVEILEDQKVKIKEYCIQLHNEFHINTAIILNLHI